MTTTGMRCGTLPCVGPELVFAREGELDHQSPRCNCVHERKRSHGRACQQGLPSESGSLSCWFSSLRVFTVEPTYQNTYTKAKASATDSGVILCSARTLTCKTPESMRFKNRPKRLRGRDCCRLLRQQRRRSNHPGISQAPGPRGWTIWRETLHCVHRRGHSRPEARVKLSGTATDGDQRSASTDLVHV